MVSSRTIPVDIRSLGRGRWVSDDVMDVTCTLLAPHLAPGVRLIPSYMLHSLLSGGELAETRWAPLLSAHTILMPVVRESHTGICFSAPLVPVQWERSTRWGPMGKMAW
jgi:hypothetical protein